MENRTDDMRRQKRINASLPLQMWGVDSRGETFAETTSAVDVSRRGLSLLTSLALEVFSLVTVVIPGRGQSRPGEGPADFFTEAVVVAVGRQNERNRIGLRFIGATLPIYSSEGV